MSCEGPAGVAGLDGADGADGLAGSDGTNGVDGDVTCLACHSGVNMQSVKEQFQQSGHSAGEAAVEYAGGRASCAECHSSEGFIEFVRTGDVAENISAPSAWECKTCHGIHQTFDDTDYALRLTDPVAFIFDATVTVDFDNNSNLCANCHQSRRAEPNITDPGATFYISSTHYGPHHGSQANVLYGAGFAEIAGSISYPVAGSGNHMADAATCTGCHMNTYDNGEGGHTFTPSLDACNDCHGVTETDFDYGNVQTETEDLLTELRDTLVSLGVVEYESGDYYEVNPETGVIELVTAAGGYHPVVGTYPMEEAQAFFNWTGLDEDRSLGAHNPKYVKALLTNTLEALAK
ncbi:MAG: hypothetical protein HQ543_12360 [Bacteroidetes bacterium]|nr:hypothetical protein [Bacteroidota bacterium]